jgi:hypothetical protein
VTGGTQETRARGKRQDSRHSEKELTALWEQQRTVLGSCRASNSHKQTYVRAHATHPVLSLSVDLWPPYDYEYHTFCHWYEAEINHMAQQ